MSTKSIGPTVLNIPHIVWPPLGALLVVVVVRIVVLVVVERVEPNELEDELEETGVDELEDVVVDEVVVLPGIPKYASSMSSWTGTVWPTP